MSTKRIVTPIITSRSIIRIEAYRIVEESRVLGLSRAETIERFDMTLISRIAAMHLQDYADGVRDVHISAIESHMCEQRYTLPDGSVVDLMTWAATKPALTAGSTFCCVWKGTDSVFSGPYESVQ